MSKGEIEDELRALNVPSEAIEGILAAMQLRSLDDLKSESHILRSPPLFILLYPHKNTLSSLSLFSTRRFPLFFVFICSFLRSALPLLCPFASLSSIPLLPLPFGSITLISYGIIHLSHIRTSLYNEVYKYHHYFLYQ